MISHALAANVVINPQIPYVNSANGVPGLVQGFYFFALSIAGILAFGAMVYGGVKYTVGRGNPSSESEAKSWITGALLGLLLLGGAYVILQTVNPALTTLTMPNLPALNPPVATSIASPSQGLFTNVYGCLTFNGTYSCSTPTDTSCSASGLGCNGSACIQFPEWYCGRSISYSTAGANSMTYGCVAPNSHISCASSSLGIKDTTCKTVQGCGGSACIQVPTAFCGSSTAQVAGTASGGAPAGVGCNTSNQNACASGLKCCATSLLTNVGNYLNSYTYVPGGGTCESSC